MQGPVPRLLRLVVVVFVRMVMQWPEMRHAVRGGRSSSCCCGMVLRMLLLLGWRRQIELAMGVVVIVATASAFPLIVLSFLIGVAIAVLLLAIVSSLLLLECKLVLLVRLLQRELLRVGSQGAHVIRVQQRLLLRLLLLLGMRLLLLLLLRLLHAPEFELRFASSARCARAQSAAPGTGPVQWTVVGRFARWQLRIEFDQTARAETFATGMRFALLL